MLLISLTLLSCCVLAARLRLRPLFRYLHDSVRCMKARLLRCRRHPAVILAAAVPPERGSSILWIYPLSGLAVSYRTSRNIFLYFGNRTCRLQIDSAYAKANGGMLPTAGCTGDTWLRHDVHGGQSAQQRWARQKQRRNPKRRRNVGTCGQRKSTNASLPAAGTVRLAAVAFRHHSQQAAAALMVWTWTAAPPGNLCKQTGSSWR